jgi:NaMN:DMB phosphoribosyltransferase
MGIDGIDFLIHVFVTICVAAVAGNAAERHSDVLVAGVLALSGVALAFRRKRGLRQLADEEFGSGEVAAQRAAELEARVADLEGVQARVAELEERLDFAERLLTSGRAERQPEIR